MEEQYENIIKNLTIEEIKKTTKQSPWIPLVVRNGETVRKSPFELHTTNSKYIYGIPTETFIQLAINNKRFDLLIGLQDIISTIPKSSLNNPELVNYLLSQGDFAKALMYKLSDNDCLKYDQELKKAAPQALSNIINNNIREIYYNKYILEEILKNKQLRLLNYIISSEDIRKSEFDSIIKNYKEEIYEYLKLYSKNTLPIPIFQQKILQSPTFMNYVKELGDIKTLCIFHPSLLDQKFIDEHANLIVIINPPFLPLMHSEKIIDAIFELKRYNCLPNIINYLTQDIVNKHGKEFFTDIYIDHIDVPKDFYSSNQYFFNFILQYGPFECLKDFNSSLFTEEICEKNYETIIKYALASQYENSQYMFLRILKENPNDSRLYDFNLTLLTEEFIKNNAELIINSLNKNTLSLFKFSKTFNFSKALLNECVRQNRFDLLIQFNRSLFTDEFISNNLDWIMKNIKDEIPKALRRSRVLFDEYVKNENFDLFIQFHYSFYTENFIQEHLSLIINNIKDQIPRNFNCSEVLFNEFLNTKKDNLLIQMNDGLFTYDVLKNNYYYFSSLVRNNVKYHTLLKNNNDFKKLVIENKDYETLTMLSFDKDLLAAGQDGNLVFDQTKLKFYSDIIGISEEELTNKLKDLLKINDEILNTICPFMLSKKMNCLSFKNTEGISIYPDIQFKLNKLSQKELMILNRILNYLDNDLDNSFDISTIIYYILTNWPLHTELISTINSNELTNEQVANLIFVLQRKNDFYPVKTVEDLEPENFNKLTKEVFKNIEERVLSGNITIEELQRAIFEKKYGLDLESAKFINTRYCQDMNIISDSNSISNKNRLILQSINYILNVDNIEELSFLYLTSIRLIKKYTFIDLDAQIRQDYARKYRNSLYKVKEEHIMRHSDFADPNLYEKVCQADWNGKKPRFYVLDGDFNMQIHVLGAYRHWNRPDNFKEDWTRPKIAYHGICTSYIGNNQIANARQYHPAYGFASYDVDALIAIQNSDINSDRLISQFASSIYQPCAFYPPKEMIDKTRHTHNELVLERRGDKRSSSFKRLPSYVVYIVDDINNSANFDMKNNSLFRETVQAAVDNDIPIVIVDRLKYAKREKQKYEMLLHSFEHHPNPFDIKDILLIICNNMIGCYKYDTQPDMAYHTYFNEDVLTDVLDRIIAVIEKLPEQNRQFFIKELYIYSLDEPLIKDANKTKIEQLYNTLSQNKYSIQDNQNNIIVTRISNYYKAASEEVKELIVRDMNFGLSYDMIYANILNNKYTQNKRL